MTDKQINAAIAKACGICHSDQHGPLYKTDQGWVVDCPNYCTDLNAMHDAQMVLTKDRNSYLTTLAGLVEVDHLRGLDADWPWVCATARQRAEAFLRTLGKWEEGEQ
jgi:hypothetical protein